MERKGIHIISNFFGCKRGELLVDEKRLRKLLIESVKKNNLHVLDNSFYKFKEGGITGFLLLSESHISIHTWPERDNYLSLDVFVCNFNKDNTENAKKIFEEMVESFCPSKVEKKIISRD